MKIVVKVALIRNWLGSREHWGWNPSANELKRTSDAISTLYRRARRRPIVPAARVRRHAESTIAQCADGPDYRDLIFVTGRFDQSPSQHRRQRSDRCFGSPTRCDRTGGIENAELSELAVARRGRALQEAGAEQRIRLRIHAGCPSSQPSDQRRTGLGNPAGAIPCFSGPSRARRRR